MGTKAENKKEYILEQAQKVFAEKGYKNVTMKDIVLACNISRGGVYLYYDSTSVIFEEILKRKIDENQSLVLFSERNCSSATKLIQEFLNEQKKELLSPSNSLIIATYEYLFAQRELLDKAELGDNFYGASSYLYRIIQFGVENHEFFVDAQVAAQNIVFLLEGLRISSTVLPLNEAQIDSQMAYIISQLARR